MTDVARSLWAEPRAANPPARVWRDWALVAGLATSFLLETLLRPDLPWRTAGAIEVVVLAYALWNRRSRPFAMLALAFGLVIIIDLISFAVGRTESASPYSAGFLLVLVYALFRWGSGREVGLGSMVAVTAALVALLRDHTNIGDSLIGFVILSIPAAIGATVRFWSTSRARELDQIRLLEREQLARELHDTVAHHVSAMVIRAQAGRVVAATSPDAAIEALLIIESEGSRTLAEMRSMVGALRQGGEQAQLAPQTGITALPDLARADGDHRVEVHTSGELADVSASIDAAVYRIAQESVTNALRHSRHAERIEVQVVGGPDGIDLSITDDGDPVSGNGSSDGFGIVGMTERAHLLGGTLTAGPGVERGWTVRAHLPRTGSAT
jgi:signal transduction histidine kinase